MSDDIKKSFSLRFWHPTWNPSRFSDQLKMAPKFTHTVGERRVTPTGTILDGIYSETYWCCDFDCSEGEAENVIQEFLQKATAHAPFFKEATDTGGRAEVLVWIISKSDFGESLSSDLLLRLGSLGVGLSFDIYFGEVDKP